MRAAVWQDRRRGKFGMEELKEILEKFISSGWALIADPARKWLEKGGDPAALIEAIRQADAVCGRCGCELDPLYRRAIALLS